MFAIFFKRIFLLHNTYSFWQLVLMFLPYLTNIYRYEVCTFMCKHSFKISLKSSTKQLKPFKQLVMGK